MVPYHAIMAKGLVIQEKEINEEGPHYIHLRGRRQGFAAWILTKIGLDASTTFDVYEDHIEYKSTSMMGFNSEIIPMSAVANFGSAFNKPIGLIFMGAIFCLLGLIMCIAASVSAGLPEILVGAIMIISYFFGRKIIIYTRTTGGEGDFISFKRSIIEGLQMDEAEAQRIVLLMNSLVLKANRKDDKTDVE